MNNDILITLNEMESILEEIVKDFPEKFFDELNGGILLMPDIRMNKNAVKNDLYVLGEYHYDSRLGRYITIYFGSFVKVYGNMPKQRYKDELLKTIKHEFTHHLESLAGDNTLVIKDNKYLNDYLNKHKYQ